MFNFVPCGSIIVLLSYVMVNAISYDPSFVRSFCLCEISVFDALGHACLFNFILEIY